MEVELIQQKEKLPQELKKEIAILYELGLEEYEVEYLIQQKIKHISSLKWRQ